jgi:hypothetical protein
MDKRRKPISKELTRALRVQFYEDVAAGKLSLQETLKKMRAISGLTQPEFAKHWRPLCKKSNTATTQYPRALQAGVAANPHG